VKTFSEAVESTMMRRHRPGSDRTKELAAIKESLEPYHGLHAEIQTSREAVAFATGLVSGLSDEVGEEELIELVIVAFSHGVMVGIEMEKQPLLVGRDLPPEADQPTEAKQKKTPWWHIFKWEP
jgi:hypothetical protein